MLPSVDLAYPFEGRWLTQNSPANRVPSHGTTLLATSFAIDFVPVDEAGRTAPITFRSLLRPEPAGRFPGFGRPILAPIQGVVVGVHPRHLITIPSVGCPPSAMPSPSAAGQQRVGRSWLATT